MGVSPMSRMGILPMFLGICTGGTPVRLMGKMPMLLFQRAAKGHCHGKVVSHQQASQTK
jgi:hypothetical protein